MLAFLASGGALKRVGRGGGFVGRGRMGVCFPETGGEWVLNLAVMVSSTAVPIYSAAPSTPICISCRGQHVLLKKLRSESPIIELAHIGVEETV